VTVPREWATHPPRADPARASVRTMARFMDFLRGLDAEG
jgi:hypothetical protein